MFKSTLLFLIFGICLTSEPVCSQTLKALFDNTKSETSGNSDWIIDTYQPIPVPAQSTITPTTPGIYWLGGISSCGVGLVKLGFTVHTLTATYGITYGNPGNPYDLSNYNLFIACEPQDPFTLAEKQAIKSFVQNGGGLMMVADHNGSDRNSNGWDSPQVWNDLRSDSLFGIHFQSTGETDNNITEVSTNVSTDPGDPIIHGSFGTATALSYHNGTTMRLVPLSNPNAAGHIWMNGVPQSSSQIVAATSTYGLGKVAGVGDSSPADDGSAQPGNSSIFPGWSEVGATDSILFLNLCLWLVASPSAPGQVSLVSPADGSTNIPIPATFGWNRTSDATGFQFDLSSSPSFSTFLRSDSALGDTLTTVSGMSLDTVYYWRVRAKNNAGWGPYSLVRSFRTWNVPDQILLDAPSDSSVNVPVPAVFTWHPAASASTYSFDLSLTNDFSTLTFTDSTVTDTAEPYSNLGLNTKYFWRVRGKNDAGWGQYSQTRTITTWDVPGQVELVFPPNDVHGLPSPTVFNWNKVPGATFYHIQISFSVAFDSLFLSDTSLQDTGIAVDHLDTTLTYYWRVRARNQAGWGTYSSAWRFSLSTGILITGLFNRGWNLVSVPVHPADDRSSVLFPRAISSAFIYTDHYIAGDSLGTGLGFWLKFDSPTAVTIFGQAPLSDTVQVNMGWNLIGALSVPIPAGSVTTIPENIISSRFFGYEQVYEAVSLLNPFKGYWVKVNQNGQLIFRSPAGSLR